MCIIIYHDLFANVKAAKCMSCAIMLHKSFPKHSAQETNYTTATKQKQVHVYRFNSKEATIRATPSTYTFALSLHLVALFQHAACI